MPIWPYCCLLFVPLVAYSTSRLRHQKVASPYSSSRSRLSRSPKKLPLTQNSLCPTDKLKSFQVLTWIDHGGRSVPHQVRRAPRRRYTGPIRRRQSCQGVGGLHRRQEVPDTALQKLPGRTSSPAELQKDSWCSLRNRVSICSTNMESCIRTIVAEHALLRTVRKFVGTQFTIINQSFWLYNQPSIPRIPVTYWKLVLLTVLIPELSESTNYNVPI